MRTPGRKIAKWNDSSWTEAVNWGDFVDKMPLSIAYEKGSPIVRKTVYMTQWHQHVMEQILHEARTHFRTETDLTRSIMNIGVIMFYHIFVKDKGLEEEKTKFFYELIRSLESDWKKADMIEAVCLEVDKIKARRRNRSLTKERSQELIETIIAHSPDEYKEEIQEAAYSRIENVTDISVKRRALNE